MENCECFKRHKKIISYIIFLIIINLSLITSNLKITYDIRSEIFEPNSTITNLIELLTLSLKNE